MSHPVGQYYERLEQHHASRDADRYKLTADSNLLLSMLIPAPTQIPDRHLSPFKGRGVSPHQPQIIKLYKL